jgi:hypothetical protein
MLTSIHRDDDGSPLAVAARTQDLELMVGSDGALVLDLSFAGGQSLTLTASQLTDLRTALQSPTLDRLLSEANTWLSGQH